ncbi:tyrosine-type recombinase/integrase [Rhodovarius sp.]|uniref:tyrosine-type recombinase/integrase n=1 Tax=Rhodovarius sp. TaxID=2972673 RepID=UPI00334071B4
MAVQKLTHSLVAKAICPPGQKREFITDTDTRGLVLEVRASGGRTFYFRYTDRSSAQRNMKLGDASVVTLDVARQRVAELHNEIALGRDPAATREAERRIPTLGEFVRDRYMPHIEGNKRSWKCDEVLLRLHILPAFGRRRIDAIPTADVLAFQHKLKAKGYAPGTCNRILVLLRYLFNVAAKWEVEGAGANPARKVDLFQLNNEKQTFLSKEQVATLLDALATSPNKDLLAIVKFLLLTGARKQEALKAEWREFDLANRSWVIPLSKSGTARKVAISDPLVALLETLPSRGKSPYLFTNPATAKPYVGVWYAWNSARKRAGLAHVRIHDLRHSFASFLVNSGRGLYEVQRLLGHAHIKTTQRYAHLSDETLISAANTAGGFMPGAVARPLVPS